MESLWNNIPKLKFDSLDGNINTDVLVIGGGICGLLCAYMLKKENADCVLVEANNICSATTNGTTAKITVLHSLVYSKIIEKYGAKKAQMYYKSQKAAFDTLTELAAAMDADFKRCSSLVYSLNDVSVIQNELNALNTVGCSASLTNDCELDFKIAAAVKIDNQAHFHPLKLAYNISRELKIYENTRVNDIKDGKAICKNGTITAKKIIVATHFPFINKHGGYFLKMYQHRSYVLALENAKAINDMYVDEAMGGLSFRSYGKVLLLGGGAHRTGQNGGNWRELKEFAKKYYPNATQTAAWATQDCMTLDNIPYIGNYSTSTPNLYVATGFNKWGMTSSMVAAMILKDMISGKTNEYADVYLPSRSILHPKLAVNMLEAAKGIFSLKVPRCPHMGCVLKYNKHEHSWDCPCHGSRFDEKGELIDTPAQNDAHI